MAFKTLCSGHIFGFEFHNFIMSALNFEQILAAESILK